jgi:hypothetical protein
VPRLTFLLALVATGLSVFAVVATTGAARDSKARLETEAALEARLLALEVALGGRPEARAPALATPAPNPEHAAGRGADGTAGTPPASALASPASRPASLSEIARRLEALEGRLPEAGGAGAAGEIAVQTEDPAGASAVEWLGSVEDAAKRLDLTPSQRSEFERVLADASRDVTDLRRLPDDTGRTWDQVQKESVEVRDGNISFDGTKLQEFREKVIPGRNESYGAVERRIRTEAKQRLRSALTPDQQGTFDKTHVDGLLPGGGGFGDFSFITIGTAIGMPSRVETAPATPGAPMDGK